jgi:hypothetical protein
MGVYENINGSQIPIATNLRTRNVPVEGFVTEEELLQGLATKNDIFQYETMPTASADLVGKVVQYIGTTTASYTNGYFYECVSDGAVTPSYSWVEKSVQSGGNGDANAEDGMYILLCSAYARHFAYYPQNGKYTGTSINRYDAAFYDVANLDEIYVTFSTDQRSTSFAFVIFADNTNDKNVISTACVATAQTNYVREKLTVPSGAGVCIVNFLNANPYAVETYGLINPTEGVTPISVIKSDGGYTNVLRKVGIIGDSLSCGAIDINEGASAEDNFSNYAWINFIKRKVGFDVVKLAQGGLQVNNWLDTMYAVEAKYPENKCDSYFIMLGHNDQGYITGSIDDVDATDPSQSVGTTTYGKLGRIAGILREANPNAKVFYITYPLDMCERLGVNTMLREVCNKLGGYLIDLYAYDKDSEGRYKQYTHLSPIGYYVWSLEIMSYVDYIIYHNLNDFADIKNSLQTVGEDFKRTSALPTASADYLNQTYLLTSPQTGYTEGGIYKCVAKGTSPETYEWKIINNSVPTGGTAGQVLVKKSGEDYDAEWEDNEELSDVSACFEPAPVQIIHLFENDERTRVGITYSIQDDVCSFSGTATGSFLLWTKQFKAGTYTMSVDQLTGTGGFIVGKAESPTGTAQAMFPFPANSTSVTFTLDADYYLRFAFYKDNSIDRTFRIWANEGSVPLPYSNITLALTEQALPESVKELIENQPVFLSVQDFNTKPEDMMNNNELNILY